MDKIFLQTIQDVIDAHREYEFITCPEDCWCWAVDNIVESHMLKNGYLQFDEKWYNG